MAEDAPITVASLQTDINAVRKSYLEGREQLEGLLSRNYDHPSSVADGLLSTADEFGREHALEMLALRPHDFGDLRDPPSQETKERTGEVLERLVNDHDRLDHLTLQREALLKRDEPTRLPVINIQGQEFTLDESRRQLRPTDRPDERHPLDLEPVPQRELTLTEQVARDRGLEPPTPTPTTERDHSRHR
jgi:hypothetical protein